MRQKRHQRMMTSKRRVPHALIVVERFSVFCWATSTVLYVPLVQPGHVLLPGSTEIRMSTKTVSQTKQVAAAYLATFRQKFGS